MRITYIGQAGFLIEACGKRLVTDPYLSYFVDKYSSVTAYKWERAYPPPISIESLGTLDCVFLSHVHDDHTDPETVNSIARVHFSGAREGSHLKFVISKPHERFLSSLGVPDGAVMGVYTDIKYSINGICTIPVAAAHEEKKKIGNTYDALGYIFDFGDTVVYHAGDTLVYEGLSDMLKKHSRDKRLILILPVNGGDEERRSNGIIGNMDIYDAISLVKESGADIFIPMHHDLYPFNGISVEKIKMATEKEEIEKKTVILSPGEALCV